MKKKINKNDDLCDTQKKVFDPETNLNEFDIKICRDITLLEERLNHVEERLHLMNIDSEPETSKEEINKETLNYIDKLAKAMPCICIVDKKEKWCPEDDELPYYCSVVLASDGGEERFGFDYDLSLYEIRKLFTFNYGCLANTNLTKLLEAKGL